MKIPSRRAMMPSNKCPLVDIDHTAMGHEEKGVLLSYPCIDQSALERYACAVEQHQGFIAVEPGAGLQFGEIPDQYFRVGGECDSNAAEGTSSMGTKCFDCHAVHGYRRMQRAHLAFRNANPNPESDSNRFIHSYIDRCPNIYIHTDALLNGYGHPDHHAHPDDHANTDRNPDPDIRFP
jgi:hypothetical protein